MAGLTFGPWCSGVVVDWNALSALATTAAVIVALVSPWCQERKRERLEGTRRKAAQRDLAALMRTDVVQLRARFARLRENAFRLSSSVAVHEDLVKSMQLREVSQLERFIPQLRLFPDEPRRHLADVVATGRFWNDHLEACVETNPTEPRMRKYLRLDDPRTMDKIISDLLPSVQGLYAWCASICEPGAPIDPITETMTRWPEPPIAEAQAAGVRATAIQMSRES